MKRIELREEVCIGCGLCEVFCLVEHSLSRDILKAFLRERPRALPRIHVERRDHTFLAVQCQHCAEPLCVYSCLTGATQRDAGTGVVTIDTQKCIGCWTCVMVCPYGAITLDGQRGVAAKCDLCPDRTVPACVAACPNEALLRVDGETPAGEEPAQLAGALRP
ncbi:MAG: 4Fe-4S dicluster domain-containing protein [Dehalococcoidia bacterium]